MECNVIETKIIQFTVPGEPEGMQRPRAGFRQGRGGKKFIQMYSPKESVAYKQKIALFARSRRPDKPFEGPIRVDVIAYLARPQYLQTPKSPAHAIWCTQKPDRDNIDKAVLDAITEAGGFWHDDKQVCCGGVAKCYVAIGCQPGLVIKVSRLPERVDEEALFQEAAP